MNPISTSEYLSRYPQFDAVTSFQADHNNNIVIALRCPAPPFYIDNMPGTQPYFVFLLRLVALNAAFDVKKRSCLKTLILLIMTIVVFNLFY